MRFQELLRRVAFGGEGEDRRLQWRILVCILLLYAAAFFVFYPRGATNDDEAMYIRQAILLTRGALTIAQTDPLTGITEPFRPSYYPVGTALCIAPFVWLGGQQAAYLVPLIFLLGGVVLTARWLAAEGRSPIFALIVLGFPASLVLGRVPTSETPSVFLIALGLLLFWRGLDRGVWPWLASGFVAGASMAWREPNCLAFVPFFAGTVLRRETRCWALVVGGVAGVGLRLLASYLTFGDPLFVKSPWIFAPETIHQRLWLYALGLLVFVPGGLVFALLYRGRRAPELIATVGLFVSFYLLQMHSGLETGFAKRIVTVLRYFIPLLPVLAFAMAESVPRLWSELAERRPARRSRLEATGSALLVLWVGGVASASVITHFAFDRWSARQLEIREAIERHTGADSVIVTNLFQTRKFLPVLDRSYGVAEREGVSPEKASDLVRRYGEFFIVFLDRSDSDFHRSDAAANAAFIASLSPPPDLEFDRSVTPTDHLRIWRVTQIDP
jgi:4-amino-4-deoxy-L-arabinose transferase-like glycosyltransferase